MPDVPELPSPCGGPRLAGLRQLDAGEIQGVERQRMLDHTVTCERCLATLREFQADRRAVQATLPYAAIERRITSRPVQIRSSLRQAAKWVTGKGIAPLTIGAAGLAALSILVPRHAGDRIDDRSAHHFGVRIKGGEDSVPVRSAEATRDGVRLDFVVKREDAVRPGHDGDKLREGDLLRFRYDSRGLPYVLIVGVDADGTVFPYLTDGDRSLKAPPGEQYAPNAVELDADRRPERVFALCSQEPIGVDEVKPAARDGLASAGRIEALTELPGLAGRGPVEQATVLINKVTDR